MSGFKRYTVWAKRNGKWHRKGDRGTVQGLDGAALLVRWERLSFDVTVPRLDVTTQRPPSSGGIW